jgi:hypothetical protein
MTKAKSLDRQKEFDTEIASHRYILYFNGFGVCLLMPDVRKLSLEKTGTIVGAVFPYPHFQINGGICEEQEESSV